MEIGAFFDIDGTLTRTSMMEEHFRKLVQNDIIDEDIWNLKIKPIYKDYKRRYTEYDLYLETISNAYNKGLEGIPYDFIDFLAKKVIDDKADVVYKYTKNRIGYHQEMGHKVFFISGSPSFLVDKMAKKYGVTDYKGTEFEVKDSLFTGSYKKMWDSENKRKEMLKFKEAYNLNFEYSYAYGDTLGDTAMFEETGNPIAINPSKSLLKYIQGTPSLMNKIRIIVERKDVIYSMPPGVKFLT